MIAEKHDHDHKSHDHAPKDFGKAFAIGVTLNFGFVLIEAVYGLLSNSMALLADVGHNFSDVIGLLIAYEAISRIAAPEPVAGHMSGNSCPAAQ